MELVSLDSERSGLYPKLVLDYLAKKKTLEAYISNWTDKSGYAKQIEIRNNNPVDRKHLAAILRKQYKDMPLGSALEANLTSLESARTFTVTTGQQIHIFLGPMYVYWKIISTMALAKKLKNDFPENDFVPVFWMASEDHDFEEVNHIELFGKRFEWPSAETNHGPVGRLSTTGLVDIAEEIAQLFANQTDYSAIHSLFLEAYSGTHTFAQATRIILHRLFGADGLVILDPDDAELKRDFIPIMRSEILNRLAKKGVEKQSEALGKEYHLQVHPRDINLFYSGSDGRLRLEEREGNIQTVNGTLLGAMNQIDQWLPDLANNLSGNVVLRPIYQETILPNIAYIAGPGEVSYWMQFKTAFQLFNIPFPMVEVRKSVFIIAPRILEQLEKNNMEVLDLFLDDNDFKKKTLDCSEGGFVSLIAELEQLNALKNEIIQKTEKLDPQSTKSIADAFKQTEHFLRKKDKEMTVIQEDKQKSILEKLFRLKSQVKSNDFTQERNSYILNYILNLNSTNLAKILVASYTESSAKLLFFGEKS